MSPFEWAERAHACWPALGWLARQDAAGLTDPAALWAACPRGSWLLWAAREAGATPPPEWGTRELLPLALRAAAWALADAGLDGAPLAEAADRCEVRADRATALDSAYTACEAVTASCGGYALGATEAAYTASRTAATVAVDIAATAAARAATQAAPQAVDIEVAVEALIADRVRALWPEPPPALLALLEDK